MNPYLNHQLVSISLNSISKWRARVLPSFKDYYAKYGKIGAKLTVGFSYLMALYSSIQLVDGKYQVQLKDRVIELMDDKPYLDYFVNGNSIESFMADENVWGEDLTKYENFAREVKSNVEKIKAGICLI